MTGPIIEPGVLEISVKENKPSELACVHEELWNQIEKGSREVTDFTEFRNEHGEDALRYVLTKAVQKVRDYTAAGQLIGFIPEGGDSRKSSTFRQWVKRLGMSKKDILASD